MRSRLLSRLRLGSRRLRRLRLRLRGGASGGVSRPSPAPLAAVRVGAARPGRVGTTTTTTSSSSSSRSTSGAAALLQATPLGRGVEIGVAVTSAAAAAHPCASIVVAPHLGRDHAKKISLGCESSGERVCLRWEREGLKGGERERDFDFLSVLRPVNFQQPFGAGCDGLAGQTKI